MKENSIGEDIKDIEKYISFTSKRENFSHDTDWNWNKDLANKIEHILSDYKRVLKENEEYKNAINVVNKEKADWIRAYQEEKDKQFDFINKISSNDSIPVQKVKDKIEEIDKIYNDIPEDEGNFAKAILIKEKQVLQELLEGRK
ncbi:MAG TPA: hypothetical protein OIM60_03500 [Clostridiaceae bacterium]|nr:hypothetical protein [Clostridiaceae bacterium]